MSHNRLIEIDTGVFAPLPKITTLNLGHNPELVLGRGGAAFQGIEDVILHLNLDNISLSEVRRQLHTELLSPLQMIHLHITARVILSVSRN